MSPLTSKSLFPAKATCTWWLSLKVYCLRQGKKSPKSFYVSRESGLCFALLKPPAWSLLSCLPLPLCAWMQVVDINGVYRGCLQQSIFWGGHQLEGAVIVTLAQNAILSSTKSFRFLRHPFYSCLCIQLCFIFSNFCFQGILFSRSSFIP